MKLAVIKDIDKKYIDAVELYEIELRGSNPSIDCFINLAFLYWQAAIAPPFQWSPPIPDDLSIKGGQLFPKIIESGIKMFPSNLELQFWNRYFPHILFSTPFGKEDCEKLVDDFSPDENLVPYFFLNLFDNVKYKDKKERLLKQCQEIPTAKNLYICSILSSNSIGLY